MATKTFLVDRYTLSTGYKNTATLCGVNIQIQGCLTCYSSDGYRFVVYGLHPSSLVPNPVYKEENKVGAIFVPFREIECYVGIVRYENPVFVYLDSEHPNLNGLSTTEEHLGEQEELYDLFSVVTQRAV